MILIQLSFLMLSYGFFDKPMKTITFDSKDGVQISADYYESDTENAPLIILFHQAGWSRGEYREIAPKLVAMGFNCLAVDLRSGNQVNDVENKTFRSAKSKVKQTSYLDAYADVQASVEYAMEFLTGGEKVIIWGSSYSSSLVLKYAGEHKKNIKGVLAFSPGEYFTSLGKSSSFIQESATNIISPVFITSAKNEQKSWWNIYQSIQAEEKSYFLPETSGNHGSRALWVQFQDNKAYWASVTKFLESLKA
ncbi:MAG: alpha/beta fold hydrolase [Bacteroidota bacterium]